MTSDGSTEQRICGGKYEMNTWAFWWQLWVIVTMGGENLLCKKLTRNIISTAPLVIVTSRQWQRCQPANWAQMSCPSSNQLSKLRHPTFFLASEKKKALNRFRGQHCWSVNRTGSLLPCPRGWYKTVKRAHTYGGDVCMYSRKKKCLKNETRQQCGPRSDFRVDSRDFHRHAKWWEWKYMRLGTIEGVYARGGWNTRGVGYS